MSFAFSLLPPHLLLQNLLYLQHLLHSSIIAIHGLNGDQFRTWTEPESQKLWLRDFLSEDVPRARVMTFGYNATAAFENFKAGIREHARGLLGALMEKRGDGTVSLAVFFC